MTITVPMPGGGFLPASFDNATKLLSFSEPNNWLGAITYGLATIGLRTANSFLPEFESTLPNNRLAVQELAQHLSDFFTQQWNTVVVPTLAGAPYVGAPMTFLVGGFDADAAYGRIFSFDIPHQPNPLEVHAGDGAFGVVWGGQREFVDRLIQGYDPRVLDIVQQTLALQAQHRDQLAQALSPVQMPIRLDAMPLQDCVDLAIFCIRTTIEAQRLTVGLRGVGGPIDVATVTRREGLRFIQRKRVVGERQTYVAPIEEGIE